MFQQSNLPNNIHIEADKPKSKNRLDIVINAILNFKSPSFGATLASFFMLFNGATTVAGANVLLPFGIGIPIGLLIAVTYFIVVASRTIKKEHPLRRILLIGVFFLVSTYTSFFSIYEQISKEKLEYQSVEKTITSHNQLINNLRGTLNQQITQIESKNPQILQVSKIDSLKVDRNELRSKRESAKKQGGEGEIAGNIDQLTKKIESLNQIESSINYQIYNNLIELRKNRFGEVLNNILSTKDFIGSKQSSSQLFTKDESLYMDIKTSLEYINPLQKSEFFPSPKYDAYIETPIFLVPIEALLEGGRKLNYIFFAAIVSIVMEIIPILLSGIHLNRPTKPLPNKISSSIDKKDSNNSNSRHLTFNQADKNPINQVSEIISSLISSLKKAGIEIYQSFAQDVGTTDNVNTLFSIKLTQAICSAKLTEVEVKYKFLLLFYANIDHDNREISLKNFVNNDENNPNYIAASLFIDIMRSEKVKWIIAKKSVNSNKEKLETSNSQVNTSENETNKKYQVWQFTDETKYQDFLSWWLYEQSGQKEKDHEEGNNEELLACVEVVMTSYLDHLKNSFPIRNK